MARTKKPKTQNAEPVEQPGSTQPAAFSVADDLELMAEFLVEAREHLSTIENQMLAIERNPRDTEAIHSAFRAFHTIKGLAGFLELESMQQLTHEIETLLDEARNARIEIDPEVADVVLQAADKVNVSLRALDAGVRERNAPEHALDESFVRRIQGIIAAKQVEAPAAEPVVAGAGPDQHVETRQLSAESRTLKVDTGKLDYLIEMVGETVIAASLVRHEPSLRLDSNPRLSRNLAQLSRLILEVQQTTMALRMVPIGHLFQKTARIARDLSRKAGKRIEVAIEGQDTELDRNLIEELGDPLLHMVRNSLDHGIEDEAARAAAGKPEVAKLELRAVHQAGQILVEVADDGRGLDREKIRNRAVERGLVEAGRELTDEEIFNLIFLPGFSTATEITDISGRGVGMDVVRRHIQKLRGRIEIASVAGEGTRFSLKLPLTLAIIDGLVVRVGRERYIIPTISLRELLRPSRDTVQTVQGRGEMALIRGELFSIVRLNRRFGVTDGCEDANSGMLIVVDTDDRRYCLLADEVLGRQEVVIKSLGEPFRDIPGVSGGAILGDGRIGLIVDVDQLPGRAAPIAHAC
jgi:two-component system chemotaxis sensor kinase CheA